MAAASKEKAQEPNQFFHQTPTEESFVEDEEELPTSDGVKEFLIQAWKALDDGKQEEEKEYQTFSFQGETSVKTNTFFDQLTKEEEEIVRKRIAAQQKMYQDFEKREKDKIGTKIQAILPHITPDEAVWALKECKGNEEEVCVYLMDNVNLHTVRKKIAKANEEENAKQAEEKGNESEDETDGRFVTRKRRRANLSKSRRTEKGGKTPIYRKLRLDDALAQGNMEGWSEARIKAYKQKDANPNAYYYRFNDPGEQQRNGKWTQAEIKAFYNRMAEVGVNGQWGVFSQAIPGRVGYQCRPKRKRAKRKKEEEEEGDTDDDEYRPSGSWRRSEEDVMEDAEKAEAAANPLPGMIDPITLVEVERPAISPYGHVLSYDTWSRCLSQEPRNICPFTKNILKKRDLVILTWENIEQYRDKIVDIQKQ